MYENVKNLDPKDQDNANPTIFIRDIENRVLQGIVLQVLSKIESISLLEGNIFDSLLGRDLERIKGIYVEQEQKGKAVNVRVEINIVYGVSIPEKSEEIQVKLKEEISQWTGLNVASIHVVFRHLITPNQLKVEPVKEESFEPAF